MSRPSICRLELAWKWQGNKSGHSRCKGWRMGNLGWLRRSYFFIVHQPGLIIPPHQLSPQEQKAIIAAFNDQDATQASGIRLAGQKFITLRCDQERIYGKKGVSMLRSILPHLADRLSLPRFRLMAVSWSRRSRRSWLPSTLHQPKRQKPHLLSRVWRII